MKRGGGVLVAAWLTLGVAVSLADTLGDPVSSRPCHEDPHVVGTCFSVRGKMNYWNGSPSVRIWKVGTKRILGVSENRTTEGYSSIPRDLVEKLSWDTDLFADFVVCPFSAEQPGAMQFVCVDAVSNVTVKRRPAQ
jgi:hypothetical protein